MKKWLIINLVILFFVIILLILTMFTNENVLKENSQIVISILFGGLITQIGTFLANYFSFSLRVEEFNYQEKLFEKEHGYNIYERIQNERIRSYKELGDLARGMKLNLPPFFLLQSEYSFAPFFFNVPELINWKNSVVGLLARNYGWYSTKALNELMCLSEYLSKLQDVLELNVFWPKASLLQEIGSILQEDLDRFAGNLLDICDLFFGEEIFNIGDKGILKKGKYSIKGVERKLKNTILYKEEQKIREIVFPFTTKT